MVNLLSLDDGIAFNLFGLPIRFYAICILTGALLALFVSQRIIKNYGYGKEHHSKRHPIRT